MPTAAPPTRFVDVGGVSLRILDVGPTGDPEDGRARTIVVLPGHTARIEGFLPLVAALSTHHRVVVADFPGSGESDKPVRPYTLRYYEDTAMALLDALGIESAVLAGGSLGGNLVLRLGHRFPARFPLLVAWGPAGAWSPSPLLAAAVRRLPRRALFWPIVWGQSRFWYGRDFPGRAEALRETFAYYRRVMGPGFLAMYFGMAADQLAHSHFAYAHRIAQPTLLVVGEHDDGAGMRRGVARLRTLLPHNELEVFPGTRHSVETEQPEALARSILDFVAREGEPRRAPPLVAVLAAMHQELAPLVEELRLHQVRLPGTEAEAYRGSLGTVDVVAAVTCMGPEAARQVTRAVLAHHPVDHVIVTGIAGAVDPLLRIGTLLVPERVVVDGTGVEVRPVPIDGSTPGGTIVTVPALAHQADIVARLRAAGVAAVDMETGAIGEVCEAAGVPWSAFRAISDRVDDADVDDEVFDLAGPDGRPRPGAAVAYLARHPDRVPYLARLAKGSALAIGVATRATLRALHTHPFA